MNGPIVIKDGSMSARIYTERNGDYTRHVVVYFGVDGKRVRERIVDLKEAKERAKEVVAMLAAGRPSATELSASDLADYQTARKIVAGLGKSLTQSASEYAEVITKLAGRASPMHAVEQYLARNPATTKNTSDVLAEFLNAKQQDGACAEHHRALKVHLEAFAKGFQCPISSITGTDIDGWLRKTQTEKEWSGLTRNQYRANISNLMNFAISKRYLPLDWSEMRLVGKARVDYGAIKIYTPEEAQKLMDATEEDTRSYLALALFAGIRQAEIMRLEWKDIWWDKEVIDISKQKDRTAGHRYPPLTPNCVAWLKTCKKQSGPICGEWISGALRRLGKRAGVKWQHNAPRHSYISYRIEILDNNFDRVAAEVGNSKSMIDKHYRSPSGKDVAERYFNVNPV